MSYMFSYCNSLISINLSNCKTQNANDMECMFLDCSSLMNLNIYNFHISKKTRYKDIFKGCKSLKIENVVISDEKLRNELEQCIIY